ncbi:MAG: molybdopterin-containing oxidoreductase family iron-sulfur binding subunit [Halobacteriales archaeon]|jgi:molybdopterin-containing oxidoreductase family iron-sulfur binding subunit
MVVDTERCIGCHACTIACNAEHDLPAGEEWIRVETEGGDGMDEPAGAYPVVGDSTGDSSDSLALSYRPIPCQHCEDAPCVSDCPTDAVHRREDGIVAIDHDACIGCGVCVDACPYDAITMPGDGDGANGSTHVAKCTFCSDRVDDGRDPACVVACPADALVFGDLEEQGSTVSRYREGYDTNRLGDPERVHPRVYYVEGEMTPGRRRQDDAVESARPPSDE